MKQEQLTAVKFEELLKMIEMDETPGAGQLPPVEWVRELRNARSQSQVHSICHCYREGKDISEVRGNNE